VASEDRVDVPLHAIKSERGLRAEQGERAEHRRPRERVVLAGVGLDRQHLELPRRRSVCDQRLQRRDGGVAALGLGPVDVAEAARARLVCLDGIDA
jgi:hypothetical protein